MCPGHGDRGWVPAVPWGLTIAGHRHHALAMVTFAGSLGFAGAAPPPIKKLGGHVPNISSQVGHSHSCLHSRALRPLKFKDFTAIFPS